MTRAQSATMARERGIAFSGPMVQAILADTKTQTRRTLNPQPYTWELNGLKYWNVSGCIGGRIAVSDEDLLELHGWIVGRRLWIRETYYQFGRWEPMAGQMTRSGKRQKWRFVPNDNDIKFDEPDECRKGMHKEDPGTSAWHKRLGRFMPRWACRTLLEVVAVRVERLQDISEADALAEGVDACDGLLDEVKLCQFAKEMGEPATESRVWYRALWEMINDPGSWDANPWVSVTEFRRVTHVGLSGGGGLPPARTVVGKAGGQDLVVIGQSVGISDGSVRDE